MHHGWKERLRDGGKRLPQYRGVLELAEKLAEEKERILSEREIRPAVIDPGRRASRACRGSCYLAPADIHPYLSILEGYFLRLLRILERENPERHAALEESMRRGGFRYETVAGRLFEADSAERPPQEPWGAEGDLIYFFVVLSFKSLQEKIAENWRTQGAAGWAHGTGPFCGAAAGMGEIRDEGKRILHCPLCRTEWEFRRLECPYCGNSDHEKLTYFQREGDLQYRVDLCLACRNYMKTVNGRESGGPPDMELEDYLTLDLDRLAQEEGYRRPEVLFAG